MNKIATWILICLLSFNISGGDIFIPSTKCLNDLSVTDKNRNGLWAQSSLFINYNGLDCVQIGVGYMSLDNLIRRCVITITGTERRTGKAVNIYSSTNITRSAGMIITDLSCSGLYTQITAEISVDGIGKNYAFASLRDWSIFPLEPF